MQYTWPGVAVYIIILLLLPDARACPRTGADVKRPFFIIFILYINNVFGFYFYYNYATPGTYTALFISWKTPAVNVHYTAMPQISNLHPGPYYISPFHSRGTPGLFYTCFYNHARRLRLEKLLYIELSRSSNGFFKPLLDAGGGFTSETAARRFQN
jgi:hypothetical protein